MFMDNRSYNNDNHLSNGQAMQAKEMLEAQLFDAMENALSEQDSKRLLEDLAAYPELRATYSDMLDSLAKNEQFIALPKAIFEEAAIPPIDQKFAQNLAKKMDEEAFWLATIPQVKSLIYKIMMPVMAASLLLYFPFSEPTTSKAFVDETALMNELTGYEELSTMENTMHEYAGLTAIDALLDELNESATTSTSTPNQ